MWAGTVSAENEVVRSAETDKHVEGNIPHTARWRGAGELSGGSGLVFPSAHGRALSGNTISKLLRDVGIEAVPHGFRSLFRDWASECSDAPREVCELALAHVNSDLVEAAYRRTDLFERRRVQMEDWSAFVGQSGGKGEDDHQRPVANSPDRRGLA